MPLQRLTLGGQRSNRVELSDPQRQSLIGQLGNTAVGGISAVGNLLDLPGSMVRDVASSLTGTMRNPFDQLLDPFGHSNRITGRELNRQLGVSTSKDSWGNFFGGLATEIGLDPLSYLTFGGSAVLTSAGRAAKGAGKAAKGIAPGIKAGERTLAAFHLPLNPPYLPFADGLQFGTGKAAQKIGSSLDRVGGAVRYGKIPKTNYSPGQHYAQIMQASSMGRDTKIVQQAAQKHFVSGDKARREAEAPLLKFTEDLSIDGKIDDASRIRQRQMMEDRLPPGEVPSSVETAVVSGAKQELETMRQNLEHMGFGGRELVDSPFGQPLGYSPRFVSEKSIAHPGSGPLSAKDPAKAGRSDTWKGFAEGSEGIHGLVTDDVIEGFVRQEFNKEITRATATRRTVKYIRDNYSDRIEEFYHAREGHRFKFKDAAGNPAILRAAEIQAAGANIGESVTIGSTVTGVPGSALSTTTPEVLTPVMVNRYKKLAKRILENPGIRAEGLFTNHWMADVMTKQSSDATRLDLSKIIVDLVAEHAVPDASTTGKLIPKTALQNVPTNLAAPAKPTTVRKLLTDIGSDNAEVTAQRILERRGAPIAEDQMEEAVKAMLDEVMPSDIAKEMKGMWPAFKTPEEISKLGKGITSFTNLFKVGVLTWPARYSRDGASGAARNIEAGMWDPISHVDAHNVLQGRALQNLQSIPAVNQWLAKYSMENTPENASRAIRNLYAQYGPRGHRIETDIAGHTRPESQISGILDRLGAIKPTNEVEGIKKLVKTFFGRTSETTINPLKAKIRGVGDANKTTFGPPAAGEMAGKYTDDMNRLVPFIHELRKGNDPAEAMQRINAAQVDYDPRNFTPTEKQLKILFPFYSFSSRQIPYLVHELATNPGGRLGVLIKASNRARDPQHLTPDYVAETASIPLGEQPDGSQRYITGTGMMFEDPLSYAGKGIAGAGMELLSRTNPLLKGPLEIATGQSFFQQGPLGGRPLGDLDPVIGRTLANLKQFATGEKQEKPIAYPGSRAAEALLGMSPLSRAGTTARTLTDTRKGPLAKAVNLLTGFRVTDVSPGSQDAILREQLQQAMREGGAKSFLQTYYSTDDLSQMSPEAQQQALRLQALRNEIVDRARKRAAAR